MIQFNFFIIIIIQVWKGGILNLIIKEIKIIIK